MQFIWNDLIHAARVYKDDDHADEDSWLDPADWLRLFNVEYAVLYPKWIRAGLIGPAPVDTEFTGDSVNITGVCAVVGVARFDGDRYYPLEQAQSSYGRAAWFDPADTGTSTTWEATGNGDDLAIKLHPSDPSGTYVVRYITRPAYVTDPTASVELPYGGDERLVLGVADRSGIKDSSVSRNLKAFIADHDAGLAFLAAGRGAPLVVRRQSRVSSTQRYGKPVASPRAWYFVG